MRGKASLTAGSKHSIRSLHFNRFDLSILVDWVGEATPTKFSVEPSEPDKWSTEPSEDREEDRNPFCRGTQLQARAVCSGERKFTARVLSGRSGITFWSEAILRSRGSQTSLV